MLDGGYEPEPIAAAADGLNVKAIIVTHGHRDHHENVGDVEGTAARAPVAIGIDDAAQLSVEPDFADRRSAVAVVRAARPAGDPHAGAYARFDVLSCIGGHLFTGDTLFPGGPGNTQKDPVRFERIIASMRDRLFTLGDEIVVHPGHGRDTTIGAERPHLDEWIARGW